MMTSDAITVAVDREFTISLKSMATAGYIWKIQILPDAIQLLGSEIEKSASDIKPGDATTQVFKLRALKAGEHTIVFTLARPWESKELESRTVTVKVN